MAWKVIFKSDQYKRLFFNLPDFLRNETWMKVLIMV